jgi:PAS domain S-box-containing protein
LRTDRVVSNKDRRKSTQLDQKIAAIRDRLKATAPVSERVREDFQAVLEELQAQNKELTAAQELEAEQRRYRDLFEFAPEGYCETDPQGVVRLANSAACALLGIPAQALVGKPLTLSVPEVDRGALQARLSQPSGQGTTWEGTLIRHPETPFLAAITVAPFSHPTTSTVSGYHCLLRDITAQKAAEARLQIAQQDLKVRVAERTAALDRRTRLLEAVRAITAEITGELRLPEALGLIIRRAVTLLGGMSGDICLWQPDRTRSPPRVAPRELTSTGKVVLSFRQCTVSNRMPVSLSAVASCVVVSGRLSGARRSWMRRCSSSSCV